MQTSTKSKYTSLRTERGNPKGQGFPFSCNSKKELDASKSLNEHTDGAWSMKHEAWHKWNSLPLKLNIWQEGQLNLVFYTFGFHNVRYRLQLLSISSSTCKNIFLIVWLEQPGLVKQTMWKELLLSRSRRNESAFGKWMKLTVLCEYGLVWIFYCLLGLFKF